MVYKSRFALHCVKTQEVDKTKCLWTFKKESDMKGWEDDDWGHDRERTWKWENSAAFIT